MKFWIDVSLDGAIFAAVFNVVMFLKVDYLVKILHQKLISPIFYKLRLQAQIPNAQKKDNGDLTFCFAFGICVGKSCS